MSAARTKELWERLHAGKRGYSRSVTIATPTMRVCANCGKEIKDGTFCDRRCEKEDERPN